MMGFECSNSLALLTSYDCLGLVWPLSSILIVHFNLEYLFLSIPDIGGMLWLRGVGVGLFSF